MYASYHSQTKPSGSGHTEKTYNVWQSRNPESRQYLDPNKLANVRRDILKKKRLLETELNEIKDQVTNDINERSENELQENQPQEEETEPDILPDETRIDEAEESENIENDTSNEREPVNFDDRDFNVKNAEEIERMRQDIITEFEKTKIIELHEREPVQKIANSKNNELQTKIGNAAAKKL
eukprot:gene154-9771_t